MGPHTYSIYFLRNFLEKIFKGFNKKSLFVIVRFDKYFIVSFIVVILQTLIFFGDA